VPQTNDPKPDGERADSELTRAYERIKSAEQDLARLDKLVSGMEHDSASPRAPRVGASATRGEAPPDKAAAAERSVRPQGLKRNRPMLRAVVALLAIGILGAAFASQYRDEASTMMAAIMAVPLMSGVRREWAALRNAYCFSPEPSV